MTTPLEIVVGLLVPVSLFMTGIQLETYQRTGKRPDRILLMVDAAITVVLALVYCAQP